MVNNIGQFDLTINNSNTIGFVIACLFSSAIDTDELNEWALHVVQKLEVDDIPEYIYGLMEFNGTLASVYSIIGFSPVWNRSEEEDKAVYGIAVKRGKNLFDLPFSKEESLDCLANNSHIEKAFKNTFPFIAVN